jgi:uncharacterized protein YchJ
MKFLKNLANYFAAGEEDRQPRNLGRNEDCWCGSGRKYKRCHMEEDERKLRSKFAATCGKT